MKYILAITISFLFANLNAQEMGTGLERDPDFGNAGILNTGYYGIGAVNGVLDRTTLLPDHKILAVNGSKIVRFNEDGSLDMSFGVNGEYIFSFLTLNGYEVKDGFIYLFGFGYNEDSPNTYMDAVIVKLDSNGNLFTGFGTNGVVHYNINENEYFQQLQFTGNNKIIAFGIKYTNPWQKLFVTRFNENGTVDNTFQNGGYREFYIFPQVTYWLTTVHQTDEGEFIIVCNGLLNASDSETERTALVKIDEDGDLVTSFNGTGIKILPALPTYLIQFPDDNTISTLHYDYDPSYNGPDADMLKIDLSAFETVQSFTVDTATSFYIINDDMSMYTLSSTYSWGLPSNKNLFIKKYTSEGILDHTFNNTGVFEFNLSDINNFNTDDGGTSIHFYDDKVLVTGQSQIAPSVYDGYRFVMTRFRTFPLSAPSFATDKMQVFPNPVNDILNIKGDNLSFPLSVKIYNTLGQLVKEETTNDISGGVNVSSLIKGYYTLELRDKENNTLTTKLLKE